MLSDYTGLAREALFRGKLESTKEWIYGSLIYESFENMFIVPRGSSSSGLMLRIIPSTLGQYVGRNDKLKNRIFEGDVIKTKYGRICLVYWNSSILGWDLKPVAAMRFKPPDNWDMWYSDTIEVIGNKYDNTELLKGVS